MGDEGAQSLAGLRFAFETLEAGARSDEFLECFPGVAREQVEAVLQHAELSLAEARAGSQ